MQVATQTRAFAAPKQRYSLPLSNARISICRPCRFKEDDKSEFRKTLEDLERKAENKVKDGAQNAAEGLGENLRNVSAKPDYAPTTPKVSVWQPAFTRRREIFNGRLAMVGFLGACLAEVYLPGHPNIMQQIAGYLQMGGLPVWPSGVQLGLVALVLHNSFLSIAPWSPTFSEQNLRDIAQRPEGPPTTWVNPITNPGKFFGVTGWGFTKSNELFVGRMAMLGFAAALIQQVRLGGVTGPGPLGQIAYFLNINADTAYYAGIPTFIFGFGVLCAVVGYLTGKTGSIKGEEDIY